MRITTIELEPLVKDFLDHFGLRGPNFDETPRRVARAWKYFFDRYNEEPQLKFFPSISNELMIMKGHVAWGFCPHHLLPVRYTFRIGYIPSGKVVGLSKLARIAEFHLADLPLQEDLTENIVGYISTKLNPKGCACFIKGYHLCAVTRGIKSEDIEFCTYASRGEIDKQNFLTFGGE